MMKFYSNRHVAKSAFRAFSTSEKWGINNANVSGGAMGSRKSEMKIQYEKAELGKNASPKDFSAEEILSTVDPKTMLKKEPSYEYRDLPEDGIEKNEYHVMHSLDEFPNTQNDISKEYGFKIKGLEPTRYNDWERKGRCTDF